MNKKILTLASISGAVLMTASLAGQASDFSFNKIISGSSVDCQHNLRHYNKLDPTADKPGHTEFYTCCKCGGHWLANEKPYGTAIDKNDNEMIGGLDSTHFAYLPSINSISLANRVDLDLNYDSESKNVVFGPNKTDLNISNLNPNLINDIKIGTKSVWDATNNTFSKEIIHYPGNQQLNIEVGQGDQLFTYTTKDILFVSKVFKTEAELRNMNNTAKFIANKTDTYDGYFELGANISFSDSSWSAEESMPVDNSKFANKDLGFVGTLDGKGYSISWLGLTADHSGFITLMNGTVKNIDFYRVKYFGGYRGIFYAGCGTVENIMVSMWIWNGKYYASIFFSGNRDLSATQPTIKNCVVEVQDRDGWITATYGVDAKGASVGYIFGKNVNNQAPKISNLFVISTKDDIKNAFAHNGWSGTPAYATLPYSAIEADETIDAHLFASFDEANYYVTEEFATEWNAIWQKGTKALSFTHMEKVAEITLTKSRTTNAAVDNLVLVDSVYDAVKTQYSLDNNTWVDCTTTIDTTMFFDVDTLYVRQLDAQDNILDTKSIAIDRKMYLGNSYYYKSAGYPIRSNGTNGGMAAPTNGDPDGDGPMYYFSNAQYPSPNGGNHAPEMLAFKGVTDPTQGHIQNGFFLNYVFEQGEAKYGVKDYYSTEDGSKLINVTKLNVWVRLTKIIVDYSDGTNETLDKFYTPEIACSPCSGYNPKAGIGAETKKDEGYPCDTWLQFSYDVTGCSFVKWGAFNCSVVKTRTLIADDTSNTPIIGATMNGKTVTNIRYGINFGACSYSYTL